MVCKFDKTKDWLTAMSLDNPSQEGLQKEAKHCKCGFEVVLGKSSLGSSEAKYLCYDSRCLSWLHHSNLARQAWSC